ncbi:MAG: hypothetical protein KGJ00_17915, partial [Bradyrhizobium sp.]|nr:hypothetical protein [Bradyrhizobium sp.]
RKTASSGLSSGSKTEALGTSSAYLLDPSTMRLIMAIHPASARRLDELAVDARPIHASDECPRDSGAE